MAKLIIWIDEDSGEFMIKYAVNKVFQNNEYQRLCTKVNKVDKCIMVCWHSIIRVVISELLASKHKRL